MKKILVNITSWTRVGAAGAEHFYAKVYEIESDQNVYDIARKGLRYSDKRIELERKLDTQKELDKLNRKDHTSYNKYKMGDSTSRFNSIDEIKEEVKKQYPGCDLIFFNDRELDNEEYDVFEFAPEGIVKTGKKIQIHDFKGFSPEFANLTEGSIHEVIETPDRYKNKKMEVEGVWVMGVTEPVKVLSYEYINI